MEPVAHDRAHGETGQRKGEGPFLVPVMSNVISSQRLAVSLAKSEAHGTSEKPKEDDQRVKKPDLVVLLCLRRGSDVVAVPPDHAAFLTGKAPQYGKEICHCLPPETPP